MNYQYPDNQPIQANAITLVDHSAQVVSISERVLLNNNEKVKVAALRRAQPDKVTLSTGQEFAIEGELGIGGLGAVYLARAMDSDKMVALKLPARLDDTLAQKILIKEAQLLSALDHDHIIKLLGHGTTIDNEPCLRMEYIKAPTLEQLLNLEHALSLERAIKICSQIADALEYIHARGFIHNDIKPANILISEKNGCDWVYVLDFGIAKAQSLLNLETNEPIIATLLYAPPERYNQMLQSNRSDVYQLGLILYECLTGQLPFDVSFNAVINHRSKGDIVPAISQAGSCILPNRIKSLLAKALARDPEERPESMRALLDELKRAVSNDMEA